MDFNKFEERLKEHNSHLKLLDKTDSEQEEIKVYCSDCKGTFTTKPYNLRKGMERGRNGCPICAGRLVVKGINDVATTAPYIMQYLKNKEDGYTHTRTSKVKVEMVCPICKTEKLIEIGKVYARGYSCPVCGDSISYPNKFARGLLKQLPILNWKPEYHADWLGKKSFDNYFEYNNNRYILEMDGEQHSSYTGRGRSLEEEKANDALKDKLAEEHGINVIRIDCYESDRYYIQKNIENSELANLFDLSKIDWNKCAEYASKSLVKEVCDYYNNISVETKEIAEHFNINPSTVVVYLKQGASFGLCDFSYELAKKRNGEKCKRTLRDKVGVPVRVFDENKKLIGEYKSYGDCVDELNKIYPEKNFLKNSINALFSRHGDKIHYKGFYFEKMEE